MTEQEWLTCSSPEEAGRVVWPRLDERKRRLFQCACLRRVWALLTDPRSRRAVEVAERFADREATAAELAEASEGAEDAAARLYGPANWSHLLCLPYLARSLEGRSAAAQAAMHAARERTADTVWGACYGCYKAVEVTASWYAYLVNGVTRRTEQASQADLLRDVVGNPFRPFRVDPAWLAWNGGTVPKLAGDIYERRRLPEGTLDGTRLGILGDALEEAGCCRLDVLEHCRQPGPHVRGCYVVDAVLGKG